ncbi:4Fe-4S dicluster domain-containing protein [Desulfobacula sp.]|uniref:4Fe-4S dicluster domain-containing protein n=1 Tax=Desulfobacula sp. TaxID=2593537 RepID=UPI002603DD82|nr:4Fe-4S dicluster domain-containing protein [Desulfobacula sp.]
MIKRSFFTLTKPRLDYDLVEPDPKEPEPIPIPSNLTLLLNEPIDSTRQALIKKGDAVEKGEKLRLYNQSTEYTISPVTGTIRTIDTYSDDFANISTYLVIKNDQSQTTQTDSITYDLKDDIASADEYLRTLPGAPPLKILANDDVKINTIVITCADMDLLSTTNQYITLKFLDEIKKGAQVLKKITRVPKLCITIPEGLNIQGGFDSIQVFKTALTYPSNLPAMILKDHLSMILPAGKTPEDMGVCFITAEAVVSLARAYKTKSADFEKILTVIGKQGTQYRVKATIGTPLRKIFNTFSIHVNEQDRIVIGGPMKGFATYTHHHPVLPDMDTVMIQDRDIIPEVSDYPCVNCGNCLRICPANVPVNLLVRYLEADQYEEAADKYDLESCIECGLCAYVCTAKIPLFQYIRLGKHEILKLRAEV